MTTRHMFISGPAQSGKTEAAIAFANAMHGKRLPTLYMASCRMAADLLMASSRRPHCDIGYPSPMVFCSVAPSCLIVDEAERLEEPLEFIRYAVMRQKTARYPTITWVVRDDHLDRFKALVAEADPDGFRVDEKRLADAMKAIRERDFSGVSHQDLHMAQQASPPA